MVQTLYQANKCPDERLNALSGSFVPGDVLERYIQVSESLQYRTNALSGTEGPLKLSNALQAL